MENKKCPNCIKRENNKTKLYEFVCRKNGSKCSRSTCPYERDEYEDNYGMNVDSPRKISFLDY